MIRAADLWVLEHQILPNHFGLRHAALRRVVDALHASPLDDALAACREIVAFHDDCFVGYPLEIRGKAISHTRFNRAYELAERAIRKLGRESEAKPADDEATKGLVQQVIKLIRLLENDRSLKRHCSSASMLALAELSLTADHLLRTI